MLPNLFLKVGHLKLVNSSILFVRKICAFFDSAFCADVIYGSHLNPRQWRIKGRIHKKTNSISLWRSGDFDKCPLVEKLLGWQPFEHSHERFHANYQFHSSKKIKQEGIALIDMVTCSLFVTKRDTLVPLFQPKSRYYMVISPKLSPVAQETLLQQKQMTASIVILALWTEFFNFDGTTSTTTLWQVIDLMDPQATP